MRNLIAPVLAVALGSTASANVWEHATAIGSSNADDSVYERDMEIGDDAIDQANASDETKAGVADLVDKALDRYREAAAARPSASEPWFRIAGVLDAFYVRDSQQSLATLIQRHPISPLATIGMLDRKHAREIVDAWNEAEKRAPLDPRFSVSIDGSGVLFERAIYETKLIANASPTETKSLLQAAAQDYEKILSRSDAAFADSEMHERIIGNLAETYMMLGDLDRAIDMYRVAVRHGTEVSTAYGLAVALDRDDQPEEALNVITQQGKAQQEDFLRKITEGETFYVPDGEVYYYIALIDEAYGQDDDALEGWKRFIASGAHPEFQPRAKQHIASLSRHPRPKRPVREAPDQREPIGILSTPWVPIP